MMNENYFFLLVLVPATLSILFMLVPAKYDPVIRFREWLTRPKDSPAPMDLYAEHSPQGKLYIKMRKKCPACGFRPPTYLKGPSGGLSINVFCGSCGQGYNITPMIEIAEEIHKDTRYILPQYQEIRKPKS
jgi:hypothetical protein